MCDQHPPEQAVLTQLGIGDFEDLTVEQKAWVAEAKAVALLAVLFLAPEIFVNAEEVAEAASETLILLEAAGYVTEDNKAFFGITSEELTYQFSKFYLEG